jgi:hypothetical protein
MKVGEVTAQLYSYYEGVVAKSDQQPSQWSKGQQQRREGQQGEGNGLPLVRKGASASRLVSYECFKRLGPKTELLFLSLMEVERDEAPDGVEREASATVR